MADDDEWPFTALAGNAAVPSQAPFTVMSAMKEWASIADARAAVGVWDDLQQEIQGGQRCQERRQRQRSMIVAHRRRGDRVGDVLQHAVARILFDPRLRPMPAS